jgi:ComF family protein
MLRAWFEILAARVPSRCEICRVWPARPVCADCAQRFTAPLPRCELCARPLDATATDDRTDSPKACDGCRRTPPALHACHAALAYAFPWPELIARFKFQGEPGWACTFADLMRRIPGVGQVLADADRVLPLPLGPRRLAERGYNQALELARRLAPSKVDTRSLVRWRETVPQTTLGHADRLNNVERAFAVDPQYAPALRGAHLVLVDDVMTSGASLGAAALALRQAGAARITAVVLARTHHF